MTKIDYLLPGEGVMPLLASFFEPIPAPVARQYLASYVPARGRALDPFCQSPVLIQEAGGRDIVCSHFSPIHYLAAHGLLNLPSPKDLDAATTQLGDIPKLDVPLRDQIRNLYASRCSRCRERVTPDLFHWEGGVIKTKEYSCANCGFAGLAPREDIDQEASLAIELRGFPYLYLLERIAPPGDEDRRLMRSLLDLYTPRSLSALVDLGLKIDSLFTDSPLLETMQLLFLLTLANTYKFAGATLPRFAAGRFRPPLDFMERNVWSTFEEVYRTLRQLSIAAPTGQSGLMTQASIRSLAHATEKESIDLILTVPPFPERTLWAIYYFWAAWIWERERASPLKPLLRVRPGDWAWYRRAIATALRSLLPGLKPDSRLVFLLEDGNEDWAESLILAASEAGLKLESIVHQPKTLLESGAASAKPGQREEPGRGIYRLAFTSQEVTMAIGYTVADRMREMGVEATANLLREWGEAISGSQLRLAIWQAWGKEDLLRQAIKEGVAAGNLEKALAEAWQEGLSRGVFSAWPSSEESAGWFWLGNIYNEGPPPLYDRMEQAVIQLLADSPNISMREAEKRIYAQFPGLLTPPQGLVQAALRAYAIEGLGVLQLREDLAGAKSEVLGDLEKAGERLGFQIMRPSLPEFVDLAWGEGGKPAYYLTYRSTALLHDFYGWLWEAGKGPPSEAAAPSVGEGPPLLIVIPEALGELLQLKLAWSPILHSRLSQAGWDFVKAEHIKTVAQQEAMDRHELLKFIGLRPPIESPEAQLPLFL